MYGFIHKGFGFAGKYYSFRIPGLEEMTYYGYTQRESEKKYREKYGLVGKHIEWYKMW